METPSLYQQLLDAKVPMDSHESDLYVLATPDARRIIAGAGDGPVGLFVSQIDGQVWMDVPFAFEPWWIARTAVSTRRARP